MACHFVGLDLPADDHARFKMLWLARGTTMRRRRFRRSWTRRLARPDNLLSETLCVRVSPELKRQLSDYARERPVKIEALVREAFGVMLGTGHDRYDSDFWDFYYGHETPENRCHICHNCCSYLTGLLLSLRPA